MNYLLADLEHAQQRVKELEKVIAQRCAQRRGGAAVVDAWCEFLYGDRPGMPCRSGRAFPRAHSLANYWGLTPGCRNSGENKRRREASPRPAAAWPGGCWRK